MYRTAPAFLVALLMLVSTAAAGPKEGENKQKDEKKPDEPKITVAFGPILGRLSHDGVGVWARTNRPGGFIVRYGKDGDRSYSGTSPKVTTELENDCTGWVHIKGLKPNTTYHYIVETTDGDKSPPGSFRTLPTAALYRDPKLNPDGLFNFSFEFACGNNQNEGQGAGADTPAFKTMLDKLKGKVHFAIQNGDWLYENSRDYKPDQWRKQVGAEENPRLVEIAPTICGVWQNYKVFLKQSKNLRDWHRHVPSFFTFDDHEMLNDVWGCGTPGLRDRRAVFRDIGTEAWYDYLGWSNPIDFKQPIHFGTARLEKGSDVLVDESADFTRLNLKEMATLLVHWGGETAGVNENALDGVGGDPNAGVYAIVKVIDKHRVQVSPAADEDGTASYSIGRKSYYRFSVANCDYFVLDTRTHREMHDTKDPGKKGLSILGQDQKKWLLDGVRASKADFIFVVSSVNIMIPHVGGGVVRADNKDDAWTVFLDEREQLIQAFDKLNKPVFLLTGDLHNSFVIKITDRVWEFASGPHNSNNHWYTDEGGRPASGPFQYGPRKCDIRWSTWFSDDIPRNQLSHPTYCVVKVNNVFNNPKEIGGERFIAFPRPQVIFQYFSGRTGDLLYSESLPAVRE